MSRRQPAQKLLPSERWKHRRASTRKASVIPVAPVHVVLAPTPLALDVNEATAQPRVVDQGRIRKWISDRLVAASRDSCWHCRKPFIAGQKFVDVRGNEVVVRFHAQCESEWRQVQETAARKAMGLSQMAQGAKSP
jgi:hypothetical protein